MHTQLFIQMSLFSKCPPTPSASAENSTQTQGFSETFSPDLVSLLSGLLQFYPERRLGYNGAAEIKNHPWFQSLDWTVASRLGLEPPFAPSKGEVHAADAVDIG